LLVDSLRAEAALDDTIIFSADGLYNQDFLDFAGPASEGTYITFGIQQGDPEAYETFVSQYEEFFGIRPQELGNYHSQAYDAANIIMLALAEVAELDGEGNLLIDREALIAAIRATADYPGLSGNITCDENGDCASVQMAVFQVQEGAWVEIPVPDELQPGAE
jgi:branched-chain amino acid transport system substrate-binding protein